MGFCTEQQVKTFLEVAPGFEKLMVGSALGPVLLDVSVAKEQRQAVPTSVRMRSLRKHT